MFKGTKTVSKPLLSSIIWYGHVPIIRTAAITAIPTEQGAVITDAEVDFIPAHKTACWKVGGPNARVLEKGDLLELNRLCSEGKWDMGRNMPMPWLRGTDKESAWDLYEKMDVRLPFYELRVFPNLMKRFYFREYVLAFFRICAWILMFYLVPKAYEMFVPEKYRCKYKYRKEAGGHH